MRLVCGMALLLAVASHHSFAQSTQTPRIIEIVTDDGPSPGLAEVLSYLKPHTDRDSIRWIAGSLATGEVGKTVAIFKHPTFESVQRNAARLQEAVRALGLSGRLRLHTQVFAWTPDVSYNDGRVPWRDAGAFSLYYVQLKTGSYDAYVEQQKIAQDYLRRARIQDEEWLGYTLRFGPDAPVGYLFVTPLRSVAELDHPLPHGEVLPDSVDRARASVLQRAVTSSATSLLVVRASVSK